MTPLTCSIPHPIDIIPMAHSSSTFGVEWYRTANSKESNTSTYAAATGAVGRGKLIAVEVTYEWSGHAHVEGDDPYL